MTADRVTLPAPATISDVYAAIIELRDEVRAGQANESLARHELSRRVASIDRGMTGLNDELEHVATDVTAGNAKLDSVIESVDRVLAGLALAQDDLRERVETLEGHPPHSDPPNGSNGAGE